MTCLMRWKRISAGPSPIHDLPCGRTAAGGAGYPDCGPLETRPIGVAGETALRWAHNLRAKIATLKTSQQRCPFDPDSEVYSEEVWVLLYGKRHGVYRVLFAIRGDTVHVLTVRHSAQRSLADEMREDESDGEASRSTKRRCCHIWGPKPLQRHPFPGVRFRRGALTR